MNAGRAERDGLADDHDVWVVLQRERLQEHVHEVPAGQARRDVGLHEPGKGVVHDQHAAGRAEPFHHVVQGLIPRPDPGRTVHHALQVRAQDGRAGVRLADRLVSGVQISASREPPGERTGGRPVSGRSTYTGELRIFFFLGGGRSSSKISLWISNVTRNMC